MGQSIHITGQIGNTYNNDGTIAVKGVCVSDIAAPLAAAAGEDVFVYINSPGGSVSEGDLISKLLADTPNVHTVAVSQCASIATKIFTSVPVENRSIVEGCKFMIHNPLFANISGNATELKYAASLLEPIEKDLTAHYVKATGQKKEIIAPLMAAESELTPDECVQLGFASKVVKVVEPLAFIDSDNLNTNIMSKINAFKAKISALAAEFGFTDSNAGADAREAVALDFETDNGNIQTPYSDLMVGDSVTMAETGEPAPDGTYTATDGMQIVVVGGVVSEIIAAEGQDLSVLLVAKDEEIATLKAQIEAYEAASETTLKVIEKLEAKAAAVRSNGTPNAGPVANFRTPSGSNGTTSRISKEEMAARRASYGK